MPNTPPNQTIIDELNYWSELAEIWETAGATTIGLTAGDLTSIKALVASATDNYDLAQASRKAAKDATTAQTQALRALRSGGRQDVNTIKAFITQSGNQALWAKAGLTPPAAPGTAPNPNPPFDLTGTLDNQGNMTVRWKSSQPAGTSGTVYSIYRGLNGTAPVLLDTVGPRIFVDTTIPSGSTGVVYYIKAKRAGKTSVNSQSLQILFGHAGNGQLTVASVKIAA